VKVHTRVEGEEIVIGLDAEQFLVVELESLMMREVGCGSWSRRDYWKHVWCGMPRRTLHHLP
jgi:hypothetical protein